MTLFMDRRGMLLGAGATAASLGFASARAAGETPAVELGFVPDPAFLVRARALLARVGAADLHAHPGGIFSPSGLAPPDLATQKRVVADMRAGFVTMVSLAAVSDRRVLRPTPSGRMEVGTFKPGEAYADYLRQTADVEAITRALGITLLRTGKALRSLRPGRDVGGILSVEGGDFLEGDISRLSSAFARGVRSITLIHYRPNELGDNQTSPPTRGGLTAFGAEVVREMNRLGMVIDVAHAAETTVRQVLERSAVPVMCSHTAIKTAAYDHPRFLTPETARAVAAAGGVVGAWPSGFGADRMSDFVDRVFRLTEVVGPDHAALGTDMDSNYKPVLDNYRQVPLLVSELLRRGYGEANVEKFVAGNFRRLWRQAVHG